MADFSASVRPHTTVKVKKSRKHRSKHGWMQEHVSDGFVRQAQQDGYRARSVYKLKEIDRRDHLLKPGMRIVDLGAAPGGWSQYIAQRLAGRGMLVCVDLLPVAAVAGAVIIQGDFHDAATRAAIGEALGGQPADLVVSDMAPNMSGIASADQARVMAIAEGVLAWCRPVLAPGGTLLIKVFQGSGFDELRQAMRAQFESVVVRKPDASRARSAEVYLLARGYRGQSSAESPGACG